MSASTPRSGSRSLLRWREGLWRSERHPQINRDLRLDLDLLEPRITPSSYSVTNTNYSGTGSLGAAIATAITSQDVNAQITFSQIANNSTISLTGSDVSEDSSYGPTAYVISGDGVHITIDGSGAPGHRSTGAIRSIQAAGSVCSP